MGLQLYARHLFILCARRQKPAPGRGKNLHRGRSRLGGESDFIEKREDSHKEEVVEDKRITEERQARSR